MAKNQAKNKLVPQTPEKIEGRNGEYLAVSQNSYLEKQEIQYKIKKVHPSKARLLQ